MMEERAPPFGPGDRLGEEDNYTIVRMLGSGGHGFVFEAHDELLQREVAIKVIHQSSRSGRDLTGRALTEARVLVRIRHPNVVAAHYVGTTRGGQVYMVMELLAGRSLREVLRELGRLTIPEVLELAIQATSGFHAVHENRVIHRDVKPENLVVVAENQVKVLDFGVAKVTGYAAHKTTDKHVVHGTALYMSPEQLQGHAVTPQSDIFSLGVVLYEALHRHPTLVGREIYNMQQLAWLQITRMPPRLHELDASIPNYVSRFVQRALLKRPQERYPSMADMGNAAREARQRLIAEIGDQRYRQNIRDLSAASPHPSDKQRPRPSTRDLSAPSPDPSDAHLRLIPVDPR
ncbi:MAG TPA: serine/threonine-protein kinase, partial [Polyangiaceae bacterium]